MRHLALLEQGGSTWGGPIPKLNVSAADPSRERPLVLLAEELALAVHAREQQGLPVPPPVLRTPGDVPADLRVDFPYAETVLIAPAAINPVSLEVQAALDASALSDREVARRMGRSHVRIARLRNPFYWGQSVTTL